MSFAASLAALSAMTVVSVAIGRSFRHVPAFLQSSLPIGEWAGAAMMVYFGVRTLRVHAMPQSCDVGAGLHSLASQLMEHPRFMGSA